jgi:hypothetical protein
MLDVISGKSRDEEVRVVITILVPHLDTLVSLLRCLLKLLRQQLALLVKVVPSPNIDQNIRGIWELGKQLRRVVRGPLILLVLAKVAAKSLLAPGTVARVGNRRKSRHRLVHAGVLEEERQGAVPAHRVTRDGDARAVELFELREERFGELVGDVAVHVVALVVGLLGGVDVEAGAGAEVVALVFALDVEAARGGVGEDDCDVVFGGGRLEEALFGAVVAGAGEAGEVEEDWGGLGGGGGAGDEEVEFHLGCGCFGLKGLLVCVSLLCSSCSLCIHLVSKLEQLAAKVGDGCCDLERHDCGFWTADGLKDSQQRRWKRGECSAEVRDGDDGIH